MTGSRGTHPQPRTVLIADDDEMIRAVTEAALRTVGGLNVLLATSGAECLELARTQPVDAVLLDLMMPVLDGAGTLTQLREDPATRDIAVILFTAKALPRDRLAWDRLDVCGVITKPFDPLTLAGRIRAILRWE
jgi:CheY-like chemotaxis protein